VRGRVAQREAVLALVALLAAVVALAVTYSRHSSSELPAPVGAYSALAGSSGPSVFGKHTACGTVIGPETQGVAHPVLPCGVHVYITYRNRTVLTQVIDHGPYVPGREFDLTEALAKRLGLHGVQTIHWSYAEAR
jgi:rare lipoprotein A